MPSRISLYRFHFYWRGLLSCGAKRTEHKHFLSRWYKTTRGVKRVHGRTLTLCYAEYAVIVIHSNSHTEHWLPCHLHVTRCPTWLTIEGRPYTFQTQTFLHAFLCILKQKNVIFSEKACHVVIFWYKYWKNFRKFVYISPCCDQIIGWMIPSSGPGWRGPPSLILNWHWGFFLESKAVGASMTPDPYLLPRLRLNGAVILSPLRDFIGFR
jgi:hypothetical protein